MLNQHYLGRLFNDDSDGDVRLEVVQVQRDKGASKGGTQGEPGPLGTEIEAAPVGIRNNPGWDSATKASATTSVKLQRDRVKDWRLWKYRKGESPTD